MTHPDHVSHRYCAGHGVRYKFGTIEGEKEWLSGFYATPNEALGFFEFLVGIQAINKSLWKWLIRSERMRDATVQIAGLQPWELFSATFPLPYGSQRGEYRYMIQRTVLIKCELVVSLYSHGIAK